MAINLSSRYAPNVGAPNTAYPGGSVKNVSTPTSDDGTPVDNALINDYEGFTQALLARAGLTVNNVVDTALNSQRMIAMMTLTRQLEELFIDPDDTTNTATALSLSVRYNAGLPSGVDPMKIPIPTSLPMYYRVNLSGGHNAGATIKIRRNDNLQEEFTLPYALNHNGLYAFIRQTDTIYAVVPIDDAARAPVEIWSGSATSIFMSTVTSQSGFELIPGRYIIEYEIFSPRTGTAEIIITDQPTQADELYEIFTIVNPSGSGDRYAIEFTKSGGNAVNVTTIRSNVNGNNTQSNMSKISYQPF